MTRGFTLAEVAVACALAAVMAALALPGYTRQQLAAGRLDAVDALTRVQLEQARMFARHGVYAGQLSQLDGARSPTSAQGRYTITLAAQGPQGFVATATARAEGPQAADDECRQIVLTVREGFAEKGPSARCWGG